MLSMNLFNGGIFYLFPVIARWLKSIKKKLSEEIVKDIFRCTDYIVLICIPYIYTGVC